MEICLLLWRWVLVKTTVAGKEICNKELVNCGKVHLLMQVVHATIESFFGNLIYSGLKLIILSPMLDSRKRSKQSMLSHKKCAMCFPCSVLRNLVPSMVKNMAECSHHWWAN